MRRVRESQKEEIDVNERKHRQNVARQAQSLVPKHDVEMIRREDLEMMAPVQRQEVIEQLHTRYGNMMVQRMFAENQEQSKDVSASNLRLNAVGDQFEQEANSVAKKVMHKLDDPLFQEEIKAVNQHKQNGAEVQAKRAKADGDLHHGGTISADVARQIENARGGGETLPKTLLLAMGMAFGTDFSNVRIHSDKKADELNQALNARAFTSNEDVFFKSGEFHLDRRESKELLAHELAHVVQQRNSGVTHGKLSTKNNGALQRKEKDEEGTNAREFSVGLMEVHSEIQKLHRCVAKFVNNSQDGLNNFSEAMQFATDKEALPDYFGTVVMAVMEEILLNKLIEKAAQQPHIGPLIKPLKVIFDAVKDEANRSEAAQGEADIRKYLRDIRINIGKISDSYHDDIDNLQYELVQKYIAASTIAQNQPYGQEMIETKESSAFPINGAAKFIQDLRSEVEQLNDSIPSTEEFQLRFTEGFADTKGLSDYISQGGLESGSLHLYMDLYREKQGSNADSNWSVRVEETEQSWILVTKAAEAGNLAQSLKDSIGGSVANTKLPKYLHIRVETEIDWGLNDYTEAIIYFEDPANPQFRGHDENLSRWLWSYPNVLTKALEVSDIDG